MILCLSKFGKTTKWISDFLGGINITEIAMDSVKFGDKKEVNYLDEINKLLPKLSSNKLRIILFIDEFPEALNNMYKAKKIEEASAILDNLRQWRQTPAFKKHFSMVLAGSVGIHHVVKKIDGRVADLNDLYKVTFEPLSDGKEARAYITSGNPLEATIQYDESLKEYLLQKIAYQLPYFINLVLDKINATAQKTKTINISTDHIDKAFVSVTKHNDHFVEWKNRLVQYFPKDESEFMNQVLIHIAHKDKINKRKLYSWRLNTKKQTTTSNLWTASEETATSPNNPTIMSSFHHF